MTSPHPLRIRPFRYQFLAQTASVAGSALSPVALALGVLGLTGSPGQFGLMLAASSLPTVLFLVVGGVWADRLPRQRVMVTANLICAGTQTVLGLMLVTGHFALWPAVAMQLLTGTALAFYYPSVNGLTAQNVPADRRQQANALLSLSRSIAGSVGPLVASVLAVAHAAGAALLLDAISFMVSASLLARLTVGPPARRDSAFADDLRTGLREVTGRSWVWSSIGSFMAGHLASALFLVLGPTLLLRNGGSGIAWGAVVAALSAGQIAGDLIAMRIRPVRPLVLSRLVEILGAPVLLAIALGLPDWVVVACAVPAGIALTLPDALWFTALQQHLPGEVLSRVSSYDWMGSFALRPVGYLAAGVLAASVGPAIVLALAAALVVAAKLGGLIPAEVRSLAGRPPVPEPIS